ncbi:hypothetical protein J5N97_028587 [Dioscorea zingiberensis]|uniref:peptidylprolyl isomerase n=1 Tax=Dioscorea zingiberensis TaxID=325984 RepID=A0A9D5H500_9LILI|nr:hypothetical protein J5N97_028587 [Dioscorea zingiberensis]
MTMIVAPKTLIDDVVEGHHTRTLLNGTKFNSNLDHGTLCKFLIGQGPNINRWDEGIKTLKKGENAIITIPSELAYSESGLPPTIPPNVSLQYDVELLSRTSVREICKDGGDFKKINQEGEQWEKPKDIDEVFVEIDDGSVISKSDGSTYVEISSIIEYPESKR